MGGLRERGVRIADCRGAVQRLMQVSEAEMMSDSIERRCSGPRQMAMALAREFTGASLASIGMHFRRDHTTVLHAIRRIAASEASDPELKVSMDGLRKVLSAQTDTLSDVRDGGQA